MPDPHLSAVPVCASAQPDCPADASTQSRIETYFAQLTDVKHCIFCSDAQAALQGLLGAMEITPQDEVITAALTGPQAVNLTGATFIFADIDPRTHNIDVHDAENKITKKTKAILPVHFYGYPADMDAIMHLANEHGLFVIEDASQAFLAEVGGVKAGGIGDAAFFAFPTLGQAACITTNNDVLADSFRQRLNNCRLTQAQADALNAYLNRAEEDTEHFRKAAALYAEGLEGIPVTLPPVPPAEWTPSFSGYIIRAERRDDLMNYLQKRGIVCPPAYAERLASYPQDNYEPEEEPYQHTRQAVKELLALPMDKQITEEQILHICDVIRSFYEEEDAAV